MTDDGIVLQVRIQPRSAREGFEVLPGGTVRARVNAPPVDDAANQRLIALLADEFRVAKSQIELIAGARHRVKRLRIIGARRRPQWLSDEGAN